MTSGVHTPPAEVVRAVGRGVCRLVAGDLSEADREQQLDELAALYAEQTDVRHPFAPHGAPALRSRAELRAHFAKARLFTGCPQRFEQVDVVIHKTVDPEVVVIEFSYVISRDGREYRVPAIYVVRVRDGEIVESRDYSDHIQMARAAGRLHELTASLGDGTQAPVR